MEEKTGCVRRNLLNRRALRTIQEAASQLQSHSDPQVRELSQQIMTAAGGFEE
jgi:hypothetical protein